MTLNLSKNPVIYVTRDIERALGIPAKVPGYFIITNYSSFAKSYKDNLSEKNRTQIVLVKNEDVLDTRELLGKQKVVRFVNKQIRKNRKTSLLVFKNTTQIERICNARKWNLLNPPTNLSEIIENKLSQLEWLGNLTKFTPGYKIHKCKDIKWSGKSFVLQFNRSHTGSGTHLIKSKNDLKRLQIKFPEREARIAKYIDGPLFTSNNVILGKRILKGNISYQITGLKPFTDLKFATIGNDWTYANNYLSPTQKKRINKIVDGVGRKLITSGWKGLFGIDIVMDNKTKKIYLLEINARQPASTTFESQLQNSFNNKGLTLAEAHILALQGRPTKSRVITISGGAQIVQRITDKISKSKKDNTTLVDTCRIINYENRNHNADLIRFQTDGQLIEKHNKLNQTGNNIVKYIKK